MPCINSWLVIDWCARAQLTVCCTTQGRVVLERESINHMSHSVQISKQHPSTASVLGLPTSLHDGPEAVRWNEPFSPQDGFGQCFVKAIGRKLGLISNRETVTNQLSENYNQTTITRFRTVTRPATHSQKVPPHTCACHGPSLVHRSIILTVLSFL